MSPSALSRLAAGPLLALLTAGTYRSTLWMLGGSPTDGHVQWGLGFAVVALVLAWVRAFPPAHPSALELERDTLREAAEEALCALSDPDMAWTPAGTDARQALRLALGQSPVPVCQECHVDQGGHSQGCPLSRASPSNAASRGGVE